MCRSSYISVQFKLVDQDGIKTSLSGLLLYAGGTVCDDSFNTYSATAVCQKLGHDRYVTYRSGDTWGIQSSYNIAMDDLSCSNNEVDFMERCKFSIRHNCGHSEDIFLECISKYLTCLLPKICMHEVQNEDAKRSQWFKVS